MGLCAAVFSLAGCKKQGTSTPPQDDADPQATASSSGDAGEGAAAPDTEVDTENLTLDESLGSRSQCRTGRIPVPDTKRALRAVADDEHGYAIMLPDLADWAMACGDDPYFVGEAMGGAVSATVYAVEPNDELGEQEYLGLLANQLESDISSQGMAVKNRKLARTDLGTWVLTFRVVAKVDGVEKWQFNYITARTRRDKSFVNLHMTVTAVDDGSTESQTQNFADGLVRYLDLFRLIE